MKMKKMLNIAKQAQQQFEPRLAILRARLRQQLCDTHGQGTTEYAILVGVLVVIAILAIAVFRPKIELLWKSITDALEQL